MTSCPLCGSHVPSSLPDHLYHLSKCVYTIATKEGITIPCMGSFCCGSHPHPKTEIEANKVWSTLFLLDCSLNNK